MVICSYFPRGRQKNVRYAYFFLCVYVLLLFSIYSTVAVSSSEALCEKWFLHNHFDMGVALVCAITAMNKMLFYPKPSSNATRTYTF